MHASVYGNNALKPETYEPVKKTQKTVARKRVTKAKKHKAAVDNLTCIVLITMMAFCILFRCAAITTKNAEVSSLQSKLEKTESAIVEKQFNLERSMDLKTVEAIAVSKLGMQSPDKQQIVYIDMENSEMVETKDTKSAMNVFATITGSVAKLVEYLH